MITVAPSAPTSTPAPSTWRKSGKFQLSGRTSASIRRPASRSSGRGSRSRRPRCPSSGRATSGRVSGRTVPGSVRRPRRRVVRRARRVCFSRPPPMPPMAFESTQSTSARTIQVSPQPYPALCTSQSPKTRVSPIPAPIATTATRASRNRTAISLGRSRFRAAKLKIPAITAPPRTRNAPVTWRNSSQSYVSTATT